MAPSAVTPPYPATSNLVKKAVDKKNVVDDKESLAAICYGPVKLSGTTVIVFAKFDTVVV